MAEAKANSKRAVCIICLEDTECQYTCDNNHSTCTSCFTTFIDHATQEKRATKITCPSEECDDGIDVSLVQKLLSKELFDRYLAHTFDTYVFKATDIVRCPNASCQGVSFSSMDALDGECPNCGSRFCTNCNRTHGWMPCNEFEGEPVVDAELEMYQAGSSHQRQQLESRYGADKLKRLEEEKLSETFVKKEYKQCPGCNWAVEKIDGCNTVKCTQCQVNFCYGCLRRVNPACCEIRQ